MYYDIIIIGSGIAGLYSAYHIQKLSPATKFLILEQYKKEWIGGRTSNEMFYGAEIVTGAGIGRLKKDKLLYQLLKNLDIPTHEFTTYPNYSKLINAINVNKMVLFLKKEYEKYKKNPNVSFSQFAKAKLGEKEYKEFLISVGYTDYENEDVYETLYHYGMEDNVSSLDAFHVSWKKMILTLAEKIGYEHFKFSSNIVQLSKISNNPCKFLLETDKGINYYCNKVIIATTISSIHKLFPKYTIYNNIGSQPFLRLYGKFTKKSVSILKDYVKGYTILPGPLQKIIPVCPLDKGVYMISYSDNDNATTLKEHLQNTELNRDLYCKLLEQSLGIPNNSLHLIAIKAFYWPIGTHYYKPLDRKIYESREEFIYKVQHPENGVLVVGEVVARNHGWTEGALKSVETVLNKKWIITEC